MKSTFLGKFGLVVVCLFLQVACGWSRDAGRVTMTTTQSLPRQTLKVNLSTPAITAYATVETPSTLTFTPLSPASSPTPTSMPLSSTPSPTPTSTPRLPTASPLPSLIETPSGYEVALNLSSQDARPVWGSTTFAVAPDASFWIEDYHYPGRLLHYSGNKLIQEIPLDSNYYILDMSITASGIWLLDVATPSNDASYVTHLGFDGALLNRYEIPKKFYVGADGQYVDFGSGSVGWGGKGELLLQNEVGLHQVLNANGKLEPKKLLKGYPSGGHVYRVENETGGPNSGTLFIDDRRIVITTTMESIFLGIYGFAPDDSFYLKMYEYSGPYENRVDLLTIRHYGPGGELLDVAHEPEVDGYIATTLGSDYEIYTMVSRPDHSLQILRIRFVKE